MPIDGSRGAGPERIPAIINGKGTDVDPRRLTPYDLDSAQALINSAAGAFTYKNKGQLEIIPDVIDQLTEYIRAADEVIAAGNREVDRIQTKRLQIRSADAAGKYDAAIRNLRMIIDRHVRMRTRLQHMRERTRVGLAEARRTWPSYWAPQNPRLPAAKSQY